MRRWAPAMAAVLVLVLSLGACGGDGDGGGGSAAATSTAGTSSTAATTSTLATTSTGPPAPVLTERDRISSCLTGLGYKLTGGITPNTSDSDAADYQIVMDSPKGGGYIGFYKNASRAQRVIKQLRRNAKRFTGAAVERHGAVNIVWVDLPDKAARLSVRGCLVD